MSHETENPLIIDVVGQVESSDPSESHSSKKTAKGAAKKGFFRRAAATTTAQAATAEDVNAAKRAACEASVPRVDEPAAPQPSASADAPSQQQAYQTTVRSQQPIASQPVQVPSQQAAPQAAQQPQSQSVPTRPAPEQSVMPDATAAMPQPQPSQPAPTVAPVPQGYPLAAPVAAASSHRSPAFYVFGTLVAVVVVFAVAAAGFYMFLHMQDHIDLPSTGQVVEVDETASPMVSSTFDQASKVSLRATADGWSEEASTPLIAYIKRVDDPQSSSRSGSTSTSEGSSASSASSSPSAEGALTSGDADEDAFERYFAFAPNKNASVSLPSGRYTFSFITPLNADGSLYEVPEMVDMVVGDGGTAVLPVDLVRIEADQVDDEQSSHALAQLKTAWEKGDASLTSESFARAIEAALGTWFSDKGAAGEDSSTELTPEQQAALDAQADSQGGHDDGAGDGGPTNDAATAEHAHDWVAQTEQRWEPSVVPVIDTPAWESPVYANFKCQEGILFETLDECLAHVREHGNEPYAPSNEIIRIDYHPAIVHYEERGRFVDVVTGYRCSICGATGTL